jgi:hypothetical protein
MDQFLAEYWMFVEALLRHASHLLGVDTLNPLAAGPRRPRVVFRSMSASP